MGRAGRSVERGAWRLDGWSVEGGGWRVVREGLNVEDRGWRVGGAWKVKDGG